jgi:hypothetical protein
MPASVFSITTRKASRDTFGANNSSSMKSSFLLIALACAVGGSVTKAEQPANGPASGPRVGIYDSRVVAYAHFWSEPARKERDALIARARAAKKAADPAEFKKLNAELVAEQKRDHLQVFSTAPAAQAVMALQPAMPALLKELKVDRLVSKWDAAALKGLPEANCVDVTDRLVREFLPAPTDQQSKIMASMKTTAPLPLDEATRLADEGKM